MSVHMPDPPVYQNIFRYMVEHYQDLHKSSPEEKFWVKDIEEVQYPSLGGPVSSERISFGSPEEAAERIETFAKAAGASMIGFTKVLPDMVFQGADIHGEYAVVLGLEMEYDAIDTSPDPPAGKEALRAYWRLGGIVQTVGEFIRFMGYQAQGHQVRTFLKAPPTILNTVAGLHAGLGEVGMLGLLITPGFGPRVRLGVVTTELELPQGEPVDLGISEFCERCQTCADECMGDAISREKRMERGHNKYTIDPYRCIPHFAKYDGCGLCIKVCPFNRSREDMPKFLAGVKRLNEHFRLHPDQVRRRSR
ncbi:MAG: 4Fe-4S dicluster domain-containing protein [Thermoplasmatota archaeon]